MSRTTGIEDEWPMNKQQTNQTKKKQRNKNKNKTKTLRELFKNGFLTSLNILGKFINEEFKVRESKNAPRI